jgi:uncharacterized protein (TIGR04255 family)
MAQLMSLELSIKARGSAHVSGHSNLGKAPSSFEMTEVHYSRAPLLEAIIDIQVRFQTKPEQEAFAEFARMVAARFPQSSPLTQIGFGMRMGAPTTPMPAPHVTTSRGMRLSTSKNDRVLVLRPRSFTFSHMPPYTEWGTFRDEAIQLWELFVSLTKPEVVTRAALRYINRFEIPRAQFELSDYFLFRPEVPGTGIPQQVSSFFTQCQMPQSDIGPDVIAIMNLGSAAGTPTGSQILLDFDVFATRQLAPDSVFELLDRLRERKNALFEACITDRARELIR